MPHITPVAIRFADIDKLGHVNNAVYLTYFEEARVRLFDDLFKSEIDWHEKGLILARAEINFVTPVKLSDQVEVHTYCSKTGNKSFDLTCRIWIRQGNLITEAANGITVMVCFNYKTGSSFPMPESWKEKLKGLSP